MGPMGRVAALEALPDRNEGASKRDITPEAPEAPEAPADLEDPNMSTSAAIPDEIDPDSLDVISSEKYEREGYPHAEWTWLRRHDPVHWFEPAGCLPFWAITRHRDIVEIGKKPADWIIAPRTAVFTDQDPPEERTTRHLLTMDPPDHGRYRNLISRAFTPRTVQVWEPKVQAITRRVLDRA